MKPREYLKLQKTASVLKEIGRTPDSKHGVLPDTVIMEILTRMYDNSISTYGLYNIMHAIETAPKNIK